MKNYNAIKENVNEENLISSKELTNLGYSRYDINQFLEQGILKREKWGVYVFCIPRENKDIKKEVTSNNNTNSYKLNNEAISLILKRKHKEAREKCLQNLEKFPNDTRVKLTLFATYVLEKQYEQAKECLKDLYLTRNNDQLLQNICDYFKLLANLTIVEEDIIKDVESKLLPSNDAIKRPKVGSYLDKVIKAIEKEDYERAYEYIGYSIKADKENKKFHLTNVLYNHLINDVLILKEKEIQSQPEESEVVIIPETNMEIIIKQNLFQIALNNSDYAKALELLENENVENPLEVIKYLLQKLSGIQLLINTPNPILIVEEEEVELVEENNIALCEEEQYIPVIQEENKTKNRQDELLIPKQKQPEIPIEELIDKTYMGYKESFENQEFDEALKYLNRYEYLCNSNSSQRNINYHRIRIANSKKEYEEDPNRYLKKKELMLTLFELERKREFDQALTLINDYKALGGYIDPRVIIIEIKIAYETENIVKLNSLVESLNGCEEPRYFSIKAKNCYRRHRYQEALEAYQQYNERRPNTSARVYKMIGECYSKMKKHGKAIKAFNRAEEINRKNNIDINLTERIERERVYAEGLSDDKMELIFSKK